MSVQNIQSNIQTSEQYRIRKQTEQVQQPEQSQDVQQLDEYDKTNPVGEEVEGIYSVSHDDEGNLKVDYRQPTSKTPNAGGAAPATSGANETESEDEDEELEKLKEQRDEIKRQLNRETDEKVKAALRAQLQAVEAQIALKSAKS